MRIYQKEFRRKMVLAEEEVNLEKVVVGIQEREKEQIDKAWLQEKFRLGEGH